MNDIFYFTDAVVALEDVSRTANGLGFNVRHLTPQGLQLEMAPARRQTCDWAPFDLDDAEPEEAAQLRADGVRSSFCVSHHSADLPQLVGLLRDLMNTYGGWVGTDAEWFRPRYDLANIGSLVAGSE